MKHLQGRETRNKVTVALVYVSACYEVLRPVHNTTLNNALRRVVFTSTLVETQYDARIDSDSILAFPCVTFLCLVVKKPPTYLVKKIVRFAN